MPKHVLITGATGNLGKAVLGKFLKKDYQITVAFQPGDKVEESDKCRGFEVDLMDQKAAEKFVRTAILSHRTIDYAILLVGGFSMGSIHETDEQALDKMISLNFKTAYNAVKLIFKQMLNQPSGGRIIMIGARPGLKLASGKEMLAYGLSKSLIFSLAEILNAEGKKKKVITSVVVPSVIDTPQNRKSMPDADFSKWVKPEQIADVIYFACSKEADILRDPVFKVFGDS